VDPRPDGTFRREAVLRAGAAIFALLASVLVGVLVAGHIAQIDPSRISPVPAPVAGVPTPTPTPITDLGRDYLGSVVTVEAELPAEESLGTGWIFDSRGDVVTNAHVIACHSAIRITDRLNHTHVAVVIKFDATTDIALLRPMGTLTGPPIPIDTSKLATAPLSVIALASSRATGHSDMTAETLVGLNDDVPLSTPSDECASELPPPVYNDMLHLQGESIFEGNSGGPVLDSAGQVVGIMTLASPTAPDSYAIPISRVLPTLSAWARAG